VRGFSSASTTQLHVRTRVLTAVDEAATQSSNGSPPPSLPEVATCVADCISGYAARLPNVLSMNICTLIIVDESYTILVRTRVKNRRSAHPIYGSIGWLSNASRQSTLPHGSVTGPRPHQDVCHRQNGVRRRANRFAISRREEQLFHQCVWLTLEKSVEEFALGGRMVQCGDGVVRSIVQVLALWITDRAEHELILKWNPHDCFHCDCAVETYAYIHITYILPNASRQRVSRSTIF